MGAWEGGGVGAVGMRLVGGVRGSSMRLGVGEEDGDEDEEEAREVGGGVGDGGGELGEPRRELEVAEQLEVREHARDGDDVLREIREIEGRSEESGRGEGGGAGVTLGSGARHTWIV